ncbi:hypothetical protein ABEB36_000889 [Hypothenemus hampei]|uniref:RING-type domain-containing protein n=1 Tax=Hypothenemus hampei TaxID=57062 RepID=A0ABD1FCR4_HYPHA
MPPARNTRKKIQASQLVRKRKKTAAKATGRGRKKTEKMDVLLVDSDEEGPSTISEASKQNIECKVNKFFKPLESDDDDDSDHDQVLKKNEDQPKSKEFYVISDSEEEVETSAKVARDSSSKTSQVNTNGSNLINALSTGLNVVSNALNVRLDNKFENVVNYLGDFLNEDQVEQRPSPVEEKPLDVLNGIVSLITSLEPGKKPTNVPKTTCPVCLEELGSVNQAVSTMCGHIFCKSCLEKTIKVNKKCPTCRKTVAKGKYHPIYF